MRHAANTHAVDLNTGGIWCKMRYVDVVATSSRYLTCIHCWKRLRNAGVGIDNESVRRAWPKVYLVTGLRMVRRWGVVL